MQKNNFSTKITHFSGKLIGMMLTIHFLLLLVLGSVECELTDVVCTTKGPVQGEILSTVVKSVKYSSFKGIPYAEPPIRYYRFKVFFKFIPII